MLSGKYLILGASGGIGSETCRKLRTAGGSLFLAGRTEESIRHLGEELDSPWYVMDATSSEQVQACFHAAEAHWKGPPSGVGRRPTAPDSVPGTRLLPGGCPRDWQEHDRDRPYRSRPPSFVARARLRRGVPPRTARSRRRRTRACARRAPQERGLRPRPRLRSPGPGQPRARRRRTHSQGARPASACGAASVRSARRSG